MDLKQQALQGLFSLGALWLLLFEAICLAHLVQSLHLWGAEEFTPGDSQWDNPTEVLRMQWGWTLTHSFLHGKRSAFIQTPE